MFFAIFALATACIFAMPGSALANNTVHDKQLRDIADAHRILLETDETLHEKFDEFKSVNFADGKVNRYTDSLLEAAGAAAAAASRVHTYTERFLGRYESSPSFDSVNRARVQAQETANTVIEASTQAVLSLHMAPLENDLTSKAKILKSERRLSKIWTFLAASSTIIPGLLLDATDPVNAATTLGIGTTLTGIFAFGTSRYVQIAKKNYENKKSELESFEKNIQTPTDFLPGLNHTPSFFAGYVSQYKNTDISTDTDREFILNGLRRTFCRGKLQ